jgi:chromosome segregation ATPase
LDVAQLTQLTSIAQTIASLDRLQQGAQSVDAMIKNLHTATFAAIRTRFYHMITRFQIETKVDIIYSPGDDDQVTESVRFVGKDSAGLPVPDGSPLTGLSGGQQAVVGTSFILSCAVQSQLPTYLLDEVDAAFDEKNQDLVGDLLSSTFSSRQVLCVSHHARLMDKAHNVITITSGEDGPVIVSQEQLIGSRRRP